MRWVWQYLVYQPHFKIFPGLTTADPWTIQRSGVLTPQTWKSMYILTPDELNYPQHLWGTGSRTPRVLTSKNAPTPYYKVAQINAYSQAALCIHGLPTTDQKQYSDLFLKFYIKWINAVQIYIGQGSLSSSHFLSLSLSTHTQYFKLYLDWKRL